MAGARARHDVALPVRLSSLALAYAYALATVPSPRRPPWPLRSLLGSDRQLPENTFSCVACRWREQRQLLTLPGTFCLPPAEHSEWRPTTASDVEQALILCFLLQHFWGPGALQVGHLLAETCIDALSRLLQSPIGVCRWCVQEVTARDRLLTSLRPTSPTGCYCRPEKGRGGHLRQHDGRSGLILVRASRAHRPALVLADRPCALTGWSSLALPGGCSRETTCC